MIMSFNLFSIGKPLNYFGEAVPQYIANPITLSYGTRANTFILSSTEFRFDANLIGFELYATIGGILRIHVSSFFYERKENFFRQSLAK